jgi:hypothetical protein
MIGIISITAALILNKGEAATCQLMVGEKSKLALQSAAGSSRSGNVASDQVSIVLKLIRQVTSSRAMTETGDVERGPGSRRHNGQVDDLLEIEV